MKAVMVMFDSLNRHMLPPYGCDWVHAPNFKRRMTGLLARMMKESDAPPEQFERLGLRA
jgi:hypothetical protein